MYGNVADWIAYAAARGNSAPANAPTADAESALTRASDYIETRYVLRLSPAYDETSDQVVRATYIAASLELETPGFWSTTYTPSQVKVLTKVGNISWTAVNSGRMGANAMRPMSPDIDALFAGDVTSEIGLLVV